MIVAWLVIVLLAAAALSVIVHMLRSEGSQPARTWVRRTQAAPFAILAILSLWIAQRAPNGRKPFAVDFSLDRQDLIQSMTKVPHLVGGAVFFLLAVVAFGTRRLGRALLATMLLGIGWELGETTVVRHYARLTDLAPDLTGAVLALALVAAIRWFIDGPAERSSPIADDGPRT
jgi:VanZ family protein